MNDPERLANGGDSIVRAALASSANDDPSREALARLSAKLASALPAGALVAGGAAVAGAGAKAAAATDTAATIAKAAAWKIGAAFLVGAVVGATGHAAWTPKPEPVPVASTLTATPTTTASAVPVVAIDALPIATASAARSPDVVRPAPSASVGAASETDLLDRAHDALLHHDAKKALALTDAHAHAYPKGVLAEERELIAIEALVALGRQSEATSRADAFRAAYPSSGYGTRLDAILAAP